MILWMILTWPFKDKLICCSHIISEFGFFLYTSTLFPFLSESMTTNSRLYLGSIIIWGLISLIILIWIIFIVHIIKMCILKNQLKKTQKLEAEKKELEENAKDEEAKMVKCRENHRKLVELGRLNKKREVVNIYLLIIIGLANFCYGASNKCR